MFQLTKKFYNVWDITGIGGEVLLLASREDLLWDHLYTNIHEYYRALRKVFLGKKEHN